MSRSGYSEDCDDVWALIRWRGAVASSIRGARGQALLREMLTALDAMPVKELVGRSFAADGQFCALGALGSARGMDLKPLQDLASESEGYDYGGTNVREAAADAFGVAPALTAEIMWVNDAHVSDRKWIEIETFGPIREFYPFWEHRVRQEQVPDPTSAARRWNVVRAWVAEQIKENR